MKPINNLSLPASILLAGIVIGGFYFTSQISKQRSIEKQQMTELAEQRRLEEKAESQRTIETGIKSQCVSEAQLSAVNLYKKACENAPVSIRDLMPCEEGRYYTSQYDDAYESCLSREGLR
jgi:hypothetical protein